MTMLWSSCAGHPWTGPTMAERSMPLLTRARPSPAAATAATPGTPRGIAPPAGPLVAVEDLHVTFDRNGREVRALRGVSLEIEPGEILGLVGESGSGKSVLG